MGYLVECVQRICTDLGLKDIEDTITYILYAICNYIYKIMLWRYLKLGTDTKFAFYSEY